MDKYTINVVTPPRQGGPYNWARGLVEQLNRTNSYAAHHVFQYLDIFKCQFINHSQLTHAAFPYPFKPAGKPYVLTVKGDYTIENKFIAQLYKVALRSADIVTVPSNFLKKKLNLSNAIVIPNAVSVGKNYYHSSEKKEINLLTVSNLWFPQKSRGIKTLIKYINELKKSPYSYTLTVLGDGRYRQEIDNFAHQNANFDVKIVGWADPKKYYSKTDIFVYYSYHDNMPNSVIEAMAAGIPIISNQVGAISEILLNNQELIAQSRSDYLKLLLKLSKSFEYRKSISLNLYKTAKNDFAWPSVVQKYMGIYESLCR